jgi:hypothetical protein
MEKLPKIIAVSEKIYGILLRLYPQSHRRDYAEHMAQLFRDQCRDAYANGRSAGLMKLWLRVLPDIVKTSIIERNTERNQIMKYINAKNSPTILTIAGLALGLLSFSFIQSPDLMLMVICASALCILAKAIVETFRPSNEWLRMAVRTFVLLFVYAIFMPAWGKLHLVDADGFLHQVFGWLIMGALLPQPIITAYKFSRFLIQRRKN